MHCYLIKSYDMHCSSTNLHAGDPGWQHQPLVITMHHDNDTNRSRGDGPRVLVCKALLVGLRVLKRDVEHLGEVLAQVMRCGCLLIWVKEFVSLKGRFMEGVYEKYGLRFILYTFNFS